MEYDGICIQCMLLLKELPPTTPTASHWKSGNSERGLLSWHIVLLALRSAHTTRLFYCIAFFGHTWSWNLTNKHWNAFIISYCLFLRINELVCFVRVYFFSPSALSNTTDSRWTYQKRFKYKIHSPLLNSFESSIVQLAEAIGLAISVAKKKKKNQQMIGTNFGAPNESHRLIWPINWN